MEDKFNIKQMLFFIIIIVSILAVFYGLTVLITEKKKNSSNDTKTVETKDEDIKIDYETILAKNILTQNESTYYVLASLESDKDYSSYKSSVETYKKGEEALKVYEVDLDSAFNKSYVSETSNFEDDNISFNKTTLLKIENNKIVKVYEGNDITTAFTE